MARIIRQFFIGSAVVVLTTLGLLQLLDVVLCGSLFRVCPGTPRWLFVEWVGSHQVLALSTVAVYVVVLLALFGHDIPRAAAESIKPRFFARALGYIAFTFVILILAALSPRIVALLAWGA